MPLIQCADCGRQVSDAAVACPQCGRPVSSRGLSSPAISTSESDVKHLHNATARTTENPYQPGTWTCTKCGSVGTYRSFEMLHKEGTHAISTSTATLGAGVGSGSSAIGAATSTSNGMQQSHLAALVAPPPLKPMRTGLLVFIAFVVALLLSLTFQSAGAFPVLFVLTIVVGALWEAQVHTKYQKHEHPKLLDAWRRKYLCTACGTSREIPV